MKLVGFSRIELATTQAVLLLFAGLIVVPLAFGFQTSLEGGGFANYTDVLGTRQFPRFLLNSVIISGATIGLVLVISTLAAFAFSKLDLHLKGVLFTAVIAGLVIPGIILIVPVFFLVKSADLFNTYWAVILPKTAFLLPATILIMKNYIDGIPGELVDAAAIDGANSVQLLRIVILPLARPILAVVAIIAFLSTWNEYFLAVVFLRDPDLQVITQVPTFFIQFFFLDLGHVFAALFLISAPVVIAYIRLRKMLETGLIAGTGK
jgi:raffinose/stachyose/melibiose transport system permease protein